MRSLLMVCCALLLAACETTEPWRLGDAGQSVIDSKDRVQIAVPDAEAARQDPWVHSWGDKVMPRPVVTGPVWKQVFIGDPKVDPLFQIRNAKVRMSVAGAGFTMRWTYLVEGALELDGEVIPVSAEGTRAVAVDMDAGVREAVEWGVIDAARQARAAIDRRRAAVPSAARPQ